MALPKTARPGLAWLSPAQVPEQLLFISNQPAVTGFSNRTISGPKPRKYVMNQNTDVTNDQNKFRLFALFSISFFVYFPAAAFVPLYCKGDVLLSRHWIPKTNTRAKQASTTAQTDWDQSRRMEASVLEVGERTVLYILSSLLCEPAGETKLSCLALDIQTLREEGMIWRSFI